MGHNASGLDGAGGGGGGGNGIADKYGQTFSVTVPVKGGMGGAGGNSDSMGGSNAGGGGSGGFGLAETLSGGQVRAYGTLTGGMGGAGGTGANPGNGGDGGGGAYFKGSSDFTVKSKAELLGGTGGGSSAHGGAGGNGVVMAGGGVLNNYGTIQGGTGGGAGASAGVGGAGVIGENILVTDQSGATIAGGMSADGTTQADAITFTGGSNTLFLGGTIAGNIGVSGSAALGSITGSQATLANTIHDASYGAGAVSTLNSLGTGSNIVLTGTNTYSGGTTITGDSTLVLGSSPVYDSSGTLTSAAAGTGAITFGNTGGASADLELQTSAQPTDGTFSNQLTDFGSAGSQLDLDDFFGTGVSYDSSNMSITVMGLNTLNGADVNETFDLDDPMATAYEFQPDGKGGTYVQAVTCFASGTLIRTARGREIVDVAMEALQIGDLAITASGAVRPIRWLGHRRVDCRRDPAATRPVRISAHALGPNRPARDLCVSPGHAICLDLLGEVLVPAIALVNGATVTQDDVESVTYWHVELDSHDILLAENLPAESYLDVGNRSFFAEADVIDLDPTPDARTASTADYCRPFHSCESELVAVVRDQLLARAEALGWRLAAPDAPDDLWLEVDGVRVVPARAGLFARAILPATAREVVLCSTFAVPAWTTGEPDGRRLGLKLAGLTIDDGLACRREIGCGDPRLVEGFHGDEGAHRWSDGRARLPAELWADVEADFVLRIALAGPVLPRWVASADMSVAEIGTAAARAA